MNVSMSGGAPRRAFVRACFAAVMRAVAVSLAACAVGGFVSAATLDDSFDGNVLDWCHWEDTSYQAAVSQSGQLVLAPASGTYSSARVHTQARLVGDFDVRMDYALGKQG